MKSKSKSKSLPAILKWLLFAVCAVLGIKIFLSLASLITVGMAITSIVMWGVGALALGCGALFLGFKFLSKKKNS